MARGGYRLDRLHVYCVPTAALLEDGGMVAEDIEHAWIEDEKGLRAIDAAAKDDGYDHRPRQMRRMLANGARLSAGMIDGEPIAWCMFEPGSQTSYQWIRFCGGDDWVFGAGQYVRPVFRGRRIGPAVVRQASRALHDEGYRYAASVVVMGNGAAMRSHAFNRSRRIGWVAGIRSSGGRAAVLTDHGVMAGRYDAKRPCTYVCRL